MGGLTPVSLRREETIRERRGRGETGHESTASWFQVVLTSEQRAQVETEILRGEGKHDSLSSGF